MDKSRTNILFLIPSLAGGGAERVTIHLVRHLDRAKFDLKLAVVDIRSEAFLNDVPADVEIINLNCSRVRFAFFNIVRLIWKVRPQVVFSTLGHLNLMIAILMPILPKNIRYLSRETIVLSEALKLNNKRSYWTWVYTLLYNQFDKVICQSRDMRDDLCNNFKILSDRLEIINNPVDAIHIRNLISKPNKNLYKNSYDHRDMINLVSVGRLVQQKGFDMLIEALAMIGNPALHLTILGDGILKDDLLALTKSLDLDKRVNFVGFQNNPFEYVAQADAFVLCSRFEGFPNVVLESLACGTPVIATPAPGGIKEILENIDGCLIADSISAEGLAEALSGFSYGKRLPPNILEPYAVDRIVKQYEQQFIQP